MASPEVQAFASGFPLTLLHASLTLALLVIGATIYVLLTPHKEVRLIREGNTAAAISLAASTSLLEIAVWGVATIVTQLFVFRLADRVLTGLPRRIAAGETAAATLLAAAKLAVALILAAAVGG
jgi:putative membrane protein